MNPEDFKCETCGVSVRVAALYQGVGPGLDSDEPWYCEAHYIIRWGYPPDRPQQVDDAPEK